MLKSIFIVALGFFIALPSASMASYYAQDYDPSYLPYNFQDAINSDFSDCETILWQYDENYSQMSKLLEEQRKTYPGKNKENFFVSLPIKLFIDDTRVTTFPELKTITEEAFRVCLIDYRNYQEEQEEKAEAEAKKEAEAEALVKRQKEIEEALANCDFDFFEEMTNSERMKTYDEREACKTKTVSSPIPVSTPTPVPILTPTIQNQSTSIPQVVNAQPTNSPTEPIQNTSEATSVNATGTVSIETTETLLQEQVAEVQEVKTEPETQPEEKPSVFKRVFNFLFGWLW